MSEIIENMKRYLILLVLTMSLSSCSQEIKSIKNVDDYIKSMESKSVEEIKSTLENDKNYLLSLLKNFDGFEMSNAVIISGDNDDYKKNKEKIKPILPFEINNDFEVLRRSFEEYNKTLLMIQDFDYGTFELEVKNTIINEFENDIEYTFKNIYSNGKSIKESQLGLAQVDSAFVQSKLDIPLEFETLTIKKNKGKKVIFYNQIIEIDSIYNNLVKLKIPVALHKKIIAFQAINNDGIFMNGDASSFFPILTINNEIIKSIEEINILFERALSENNKRKIISYLFKISQKSFDAKNDLEDFNEYLQTVKNASKEDFNYSKIVEKGKNVLGAEKQYFVAEFPDNVENFNLYFSTKTESLFDERMVFSKFQDKHPKEKENLFNVFHNESYKYGIADKNGNIIISADYYGLSKRGNYYYLQQKKGTDTTILNWLDVKNKKLVPLPDFLNFDFSINDEIDVFYNKENKLGAYKNRKNMILPFDYWSFDKFGTYIIAHNKRHGGVDIFDSSLNKVSNKGIEGYSIPSESDKLLVVEKNHKYGLINDKLEFIVPFKYDYVIQQFPNNENLFIVALQSDNDILYGLINDKGKIVQPITFSVISDLESEGFIKFSKNERWGFMNTRGEIIINAKYDYVDFFTRGYAIVELNGKKGYINTKGDLIIQPQFTDCKDFNNGYAFVFTEKSYGIINNKGVFVLQVNKKVNPEELQSDNVGTKQTYSIDNKVYSYKGDIIDLN
jgi:hypothetical protein